jgi:hypothetical protein
MKSRIFAALRLLVFMCIVCVGGCGGGGYLESTSTPHETPAMMVEIWKVKVRESLAARREPYWGPPVGEGKSLGFRKISERRGRWVAKLRNHTGHHSRVIGDLSDTLGYEQARDAALKWFRLFESGITDGRSSP